MNQQQFSITEDYTFCKVMEDNPDICQSKGYDLQYRDADHQ